MELHPLTPDRVLRWTAAFVLASASVLVLERGAGAGEVTTTTTEATTTTTEPPPTTTTTEPPPTTTTTTTAPPEESAVVVTDQDARGIAAVVGVTLGTVLGGALTGRRY